MKIKINTGSVVSVPVFEDGKFKHSIYLSSADGEKEVDDKIATSLIEKKLACAVNPKPEIKANPAPKAPAKEKSEPEVKNEPLKPGRKRI